ncbi:MAG: DUF4870 domain-containing protein [Planctomycetota bacterium]
MPDDFSAESAFEIPVDAPETAPEERTLVILTHLSLLLHLIVPVFAVLAPIIVWRSKRESSVFVADHAVEALNFQITLTIYTLAVVVLSVVTCGVGVMLSWVPYALGLIGMILAVIASNEGRYFRYPMSLRLIADKG